MLNNKAKKDYFKKKLEAIQKQLWDFEFKREKTLMIREEIRHEYDGVQSKLSVINNQISALPKEKEKWSDEDKRLEDQKVILERDRDRYVEQMKGLDIEVFGSKKTNDFPDGHDGIDQTMEALRELVGMVKNYIKTI